MDWWVTDPPVLTVGTGVGSAILEPPATNTSPEASSVAVCTSRWLVMEPVVLQVLLPGSYSSADAKVTRFPFCLLPPPATSTLPDRSTVEVKAERATFMSPVASQLVSAGS
ncbi:MAG TPA: hypothetical protein VM142_02650 [Acidimicrobiales bacterium]|nr:hypothetical protein [Acidimicrobiales bacterium]